METMIRSGRDSQADVAGHKAVFTDRGTGGAVL
jgi:hypothetical protein